MVFSSFIFLFAFLPVCLLGFLIASRIDQRAAKLWLCAASLVFYGWWELRWVPVLLVSILFNYMIGSMLIRRANAGRPTGPVLTTAVFLNLAALVYYKYLRLILQSVGVPEHLVPLTVGLPLGISFFTFTQIAFLVDVSQGFRERYTPTNYLLFVTFFPHLIAGPIVHHRDLMPQFEEDRNYRFQPQEFAIGLAIFSIGLTKKTLIADNASAISIRLLETGQLSATGAWFGILCYSMQLYFDFSGYSDMAIGLARMFGIKFPLNFDSPYKATNIIEFWQRWHITLTRFLTAYLYNPIALAIVRRRAGKGLSTGKRVSRTPAGFLEMIAFPTMVTMLLAGIWHGAGSQFAIFGALHGFYIAVNHAWRTFGPEEKPHGRAAALAKSIGYGLLVYVCVLLAQIFFRATSTPDAMRVLTGMLGLSADGGEIPKISPLELVTLGGALAIAWLAPNTQEIMANYDPAITLGRKIDGSRVRARLNLIWAVIFGAILAAGLVSIKSGQPFIYFQF